MLPKKFPEPLTLLAHPQAFCTRGSAITYYILRCRGCKVKVECGLTDVAGDATIKGYGIQGACT